MRENPVERARHRRANAGLSRQPDVGPAAGDTNTVARERMALVRRGQTLGFGALVLILATIIILAAIGQPWVAVTVTTAGLPVVVAIFVTGRHQPPTS